MHLFSERAVEPVFEGRWRCCATGCRYFADAGIVHGSRIRGREMSSRSADQLLAGGSRENAHNGKCSILLIVTTTFAGRGLNDIVFPFHLIRSTVS